jgi:arylsulfatase A-like enzyme
VIDAAPALPRNVIVVLLDSLNRHLIGPYGSTEFDTPTLDRFAQHAITFTNHHSGSLPCMPARHDLLCGAMDFLWRPWGSIEVWEDSITYDLRRAGVVTQLVTDHPHLFEAGGENYHTDFSAWEYLRGHEDDPWKTRVDPSFVGAPALPAATGPLPRGYDKSRTWFTDEGDFPGPRTMTAAARWLATNAGAHDRFFLLIDEFDPHEPFDTPEPWASRYGAWAGPRVIWPPYAPPGSAHVPDEATGRQIRSNYGAKLSMIDHWLGVVVGEIDRQGLWDDTAVFVLTDHGHFLGERGGTWGKPAVPVFSEMGHIPLMVAWPNSARRTCDELTATVDVHATLCEIFGVAPAHRTHGQSLVNVLRGNGEHSRRHALTGVWGRDVTFVDRHWRFSRAAVRDNRPLSMYSNRWSTMPVHALPELRLPRPDSRAWLDRMPGSDVPVIRQPFERGDRLPFWARGGDAGADQLFDRHEDPAESTSRPERIVAAGVLEALREALIELEAPAEQLERLALG